MPVIDVLYKEGERDWRMKTYIGLDDEVYLKSIDVTLKMADIYQKIIRSQSTRKKTFLSKLPLQGTFNLPLT